ncbi:type III pantothenate kinase [Lewinella sp. W8]|uniref:type III pantothenate kinase n=1 Tax=Lewinella sp. W8 TaxID=2528208 RepID=UPI00106726BB|nr:type III pantothenate kinase [Lewinella sp. W8]MTB53334.1 type III pantothenate kinase [Lewinella sp. W8]
MSTSIHQLAIDIGNTGTKAALFHFRRMIDVPFSVSGQDWSTLDEVVTNHGVKNIIYSTVANEPPLVWIDKWESEHRRVVRLHHGLPLPFGSRYRTMDTLGLDRMAAMAGAMGLRKTPAPARRCPPDQPGQTAQLIVDAGTCATIDLLDAEGVFVGGNISPGLHMRLRAMHEFTARLPLPSAENPVGILGDSTLNALRHGGQMGLVYEIEGLYERLSATYPGLELLLTGGDAAWIGSHLKIAYSHHPYLVLEGLIQILSNYVENEL